MAVCIVGSRVETLCLVLVNGNQWQSEGKEEDEENRSTPEMRQLHRISGPGLVCFPMISRARVHDD